MRRPRASTFTAACAACVLVLASCGEGRDDVVTELGPRPARAFVVSVLDTDQRRFRYGEEISVTFGGDPGTVALDYGGQTPIAPMHVDGLTHRFLLERSPTVLRWDNGGSLFLEYDPIIMPHPRVPALTKVWPKFDAQHVSYANINTRTNVHFTFNTGAHRRDVIPRLRVDTARITGPHGKSWEPEASAGLYGFSLARRPDAPYERAQTYRVHVEVTFVVAPDDPRIYDYQFRIQD